jgi:quercetin dioxygenase-like cupin family protein
MERVSPSETDSTEAVDGVHLARLAAGAEMSVQHFRIEPGAVVPEHAHPHEQTGYLTAGTLTFLVDGDEIVVSAGDSYVVPGDEPHAAENRGDVTVEGVDVFAPPRLDPDWTGDEG